MDNQSQKTSPDKVYCKKTTLGCVKVTYKSFKPSDK